MLSLNLLIRIKLRKPWSPPQQFRASIDLGCIVERKISRKNYANCRTTIQTFFLSPLPNTNAAALTTNGGEKKRDSPWIGSTTFFVCFMSEATQKMNNNSFAKVLIYQIERLKATITAKPVSMPFHDKNIIYNFEWWRGADERAEERSKDCLHKHNKKKITKERRAKKKSSDENSLRPDRWK